jgi:Flp pilus assembly protein CpaB
VELEYSDKNRRRSKLYIAVGVIVALLVAATVFLALQASGLTSQDTVTMRTVVVAVRDIAARKPIEEGDVATRNVPADATNETAMARIDEALGRVTGVPVATGQLITQNLLASATTGQPFSVLEPGQEFDPSMPDLRAISMTVADDRAVGGTLVPGQRVDLIATMTVNPVIGDAGAEQAAQAGLVSGPSTKTTLQMVDIIAKMGSLYIVRTDLETAEKITQLMVAGASFTFVLRADEDDRMAETPGSTIDQLIEEYGFPAPEIAEVTRQAPE